MFEKNPKRTIFVSLLVSWLAGFAKTNEEAIANRVSNAAVRTFGIILAGFLLAILAGFLPGVAAGLAVIMALTLIGSNANAIGQTIARATS